MLFLGNAPLEKPLIFSEIGLIISGFLIAISESFIPEEATLREKLEKECHIHALHRHVENYTDVLNVTVRYEGWRFLGIDDPSQKFSVLGELDIDWKHPCAQWENDPAWKQIQGLDLFGFKVWLPPLMHLNAYNDPTAINAIGRSATVFFTSDGNITNPLFGTLHSYCPLDFFHASLMHFPFDRQACSISVFSWFYHHKVKLHLSSDPPALTVLPGFTSANDMWSLDGFNSSFGHVWVQGGQCDSVTFTFNLRRRSSILVVSTIMPTILFILLLLATPFLPVDSTDRPMFCTTVVLAFAVLQWSISEKLPDIAEVTLLDLFLAYQLIIAVLCTIQTTVMCAVTTGKSCKRSVKICGQNFLLVRIVDICVFLAISLITLIVDTTLLVRMAFRI